MMKFLWTHGFRYFIFPDNKSVIFLIRIYVWSTKNSWMSDHLLNVAIIFRNFYNICVGNIWLTLQIFIPKLSLLLVDVLAAVVYFCVIKKLQSYASTCNNYFFILLCKLTHSYSIGINSVRSRKFRKICCEICNNYW